MPTDRFLYINSGVPTEKASLDTSSGEASAGRIVALDSGGKLSTTMMPAGIASDSATFPASEALSANHLVNVWLDGSTTKVRKAQADVAGKEANGFVISGFSQSETATVYFDGQITGISPAVTPGATYYLDADAPGAFTSTAPSTAGNVVQSIGKAISTSSISFEAGQVFVKA